MPPYYIFCSQLYGEFIADKCTPEDISMWDDGAYYAIFKVDYEGDVLLSIYADNGVWKPLPSKEDTCHESSI